MKGSTNYATTQTAVELLGIANNGIAVAEDLNRQLQFFVVLAKNYLGGQDACLVFDRDGKLMKGTEKINSVDVNCKPIIVSLPNSNTYVVAMLNNNQQPVYHVVNMGLPGYGPVGNMGEVLSANNPLDANSSITSKHGLHFTGSEDHINGHTMIFDTRYTADPAAAGQGTTDIMAYDFGSSTLTPVANKLYSSYGCGDTKQGQLQISPDGSQLAWWRYTNNLGGFDHRNAEIHTLPLNASKTALSGPVVTRSISAAGSYGNGALEFIKNSSDLLYSQRGLYKENNNGTGPAYDRNVWKYSPVNLSSVRINPNTSSPMISYLFGEIKRGSDGNYYIPQMGKANDQIHAYNNANFNSDISLGDTMYKLSSSLPTQVYKIFEDPTARVKEFVRSVGNKAYELKDHLGNVRVVISDVKQFAMTGSTGNYYLDLQFFPEVKNYTDYYAFGMMMPGRSYVNGSGYRYGFNGKENDSEISGIGNIQDYGLRIYDSRIGKFLSVDPLTSSYPWYTPYQFAGNSPIKFIDLDGGEPKDPGAYNGQGEVASQVEGGTTCENTENYRWTWDNNSWKNVDFNVTNSELTQIFPTGKSDALRQIETSVNLEGSTYGIIGKRILAHFLSQAGHEVGGFSKGLDLEENLNYSVDGLVSTFSNYFYKGKPVNGKLDASLYGYVKDAKGNVTRSSDKEGIANQAYGGRMGNGDFASGDGYKYRGRGIFQLTGKSNYSAFNLFINSTDFNFVDNPTLISTSTEYSIKSAMWYFNTQVINNLSIESATVEDVTRKVNGGTNGLSDRQKIFDKGVKVLK